MQTVFQTSLAHFIIHKNQTVHPTGTLSHPSKKSLEYKTKSNNKNNIDKTLMYINHFTEY